MGGRRGMNIVSDHDMSTLCYQEVAHDLLCWPWSIEALVHANFAFSNHIASLLPKRHLFHFKSTIGVFHLFKGASKYKSGWFMFWEPQNCGLTFVLCQNSSNVPETTTEEEVTGFDLESFFEWPEVDYNQIKSILNVIDWVTVFYFCVEYIVR